MRVGCRGMSGRASARRARWPSASEAPTSRFGATNCSDRYRRSASASSGARTAALCATSTRSDASPSATGATTPCTGSRTSPRSTWHAVRSGERHDCDQRAVRSAHLEDQVGAWRATLVIPADWRADIERLQRQEAQVQRPAVDTARIERQLANLRDLFAEADITREEYVCLLYTSD